MRRRLAAVAAILSATSGSELARAQSVQCMTDWSEARSVVAAESLTTVEQVVKQAPSKLGGDVVRLALCRSKDGFTYRLVLRDPSGNMRLVIVDARHPFPN